MNYSMNGGRDRGGGWLMSGRDEMWTKYMENVLRERMTEIRIRIPTGLYMKLMARSQKLGIPIDGDDGIITILLERYFRELGE
jgi:hypothetical protein